jgi:ferredoxin--NADP+ reductase
MSMVRDFETYERFEHVILAHGVRYVSELGYSDYLQNELPQHEFLGELVQKQLHYYPTVTRESHPISGRLTDALRDNRMAQQFGLPDLDPAHDRVMICGNPDMLDELIALLESRGFREGSSHEPAHYTIERAFVER